MTDFTTLDSNDYGADKILTTATVQALYENGVWAGEGATNDVRATSTYNSGSGTWNKPAGHQSGDTVLIELWGGGGSGGAARQSGSNPRASGGEGGTYLCYALRYGDCPSTISYSVGDGGAAVSRGSDGVTNGNAGGDSTVTISGVTFTAKGGAGGGANNAGTDQTTTAQTSATINSFELTAVLPWAAGNGGQGRPAGSGSQAGGDSLFGGGGGGGSEQGGDTTGAGGASFHAGAGGAGAQSAGATATSGTAPAGGGGAVTSNGGTITSGAGGAGRVLIRVLNGWHPVPTSRR